MEMTCRRFLFVFSNYHLSPSLDHQKTVESIKARPKNEMKAMAASNRSVHISPGTCFFPFSRQINTFYRPRRRLCFTNSKGKSMGMNQELFFQLPLLSLDYVSEINAFYFLIYASFCLAGLGRYGLGVCVRSPGFEVAAVDGGKERAQVSAAWDEEPYELLSNGKIQYLDEQDVVTFLDPPKELIPLDPAAYNPAAYLWKKIEDIPKERRHRLLHLLSPRCISRAWGIAGTRYENPKLVKKMASSLLQNEDGTVLEYYNCLKSGGQIPIAWINRFKKALFSCKDGKTYGRFIGMSLLAGFANSFSPLYFEVTQLKEVMSTEHPCDLAYEFGDGLFDIHEYPEGFPAPVKHRNPFNDQLVVYIRYLGPGVLVGQAWQEGKALEQVPRKLCSEILMIKDYSPHPLQEKQ